MVVPLAVVRSAVPDCTWASKISAPSSQLVILVSTAVPRTPIAAWRNLILKRTLEVPIAFLIRAGKIPYRCSTEATPPIWPETVSWQLLPRLA